MEILKLIGQPESETLEYKAVLPPARTLAQIICSFANSSGGTILLGVKEDHNGIMVMGLSDDFRANTIVHKALDLLAPKPNVKYGYESINGKSVYYINVDKNSINVELEGKTYIRINNQSSLKNPHVQYPTVLSFPKLESLSKKLVAFRSYCSGSMSKYSDHLQNIIRLIADLQKILYPNSFDIPTNIEEGRVLLRVLFSSCADNFETYLSDLLYEIFLAKPETLKTDGQISVKEVLDCNDIQDFIIYYARKKLSKLQRGSVKGFLKDNDQISGLNVITPIEQDEIEKILQIRHLYAHRNGIVDEKFLTYFRGAFKLNDVHLMSIEEALGYIEYLIEICNKIDRGAVQKYNLATIS